MGPREDAGNRLRVGNVLLLENARRECCLVIAVKDRYRSLQDDDPVVELLVDKVDSAAGKFHAVFKRLALRVEAGKGWQKRGMNVDDALGVGADEVVGKQPHVPGKTDEVDVTLLESGNHLGVMLFARAAAGFHDDGG